MFFFLFFFGSSLFSGSYHSRVMYTKRQVLSNYSSALCLQCMLYAYRRKRRFGRNGFGRMRRSSAADVVEQKTVRARFCDRFTPVPRPFRIIPVNEQPQFYRSGWVHSRYINDFMQGREWNLTNLALAWVELQRVAENGLSACGNY